MARKPYVFSDHIEQHIDEVCALAERMEGRCETPFEYVKALRRVSYILVKEAATLEKELSPEAADESPE